MHDMGLSSRRMVQHVLLWHPEMKRGGRVRKREGERERENLRG